ncbi:hypothetical protein Rhe02_04240 [Rhizocola hellebori]|uniref:Endonuclease/exonuclease/phosphatase domain-containing protein n=2 Tax=Rhizocola hellebori TaxID=1392758 RepID=A0A8J3Q2R3_9ACTN|nr:hypothetical protein Rhe02_04240 [Rhizocola hellebori]
MAGLVSIAAVVTGSAVAEPQVLVVLQMNLCASGFAGCYTGRSVQQAATLIRTYAPDVVTVNEICRNDIAALQAALRAASPGATVAGAFQAVPAGRTGRATQCRDGQDYGIGVVARFAHPTQTPEFHGSPYPMQSSGHPEQRVWLCVRAQGRFVVCTTHLALDASTASAQCGYLLGTAVPSLRAGPAKPVGAVISGDFNLPYDGNAGLRGCTPPGYLSRTDGGLQHMLATTDFTVLASTRIDMAGTTDHPALLSTVVRRL